MWCTEEAHGDVRRGTSCMVSLLAPKLLVGLCLYAVYEGYAGLGHGSPEGSAFGTLVADMSAHMRLYLWA